MEKLIIDFVVAALATRLSNRFSLDLSEVEEEIVAALTTNQCSRNDSSSQAIETPKKESPMKKKKTPAKKETKEKPAKKETPKKETKEKPAKKAKEPTVAELKALAKSMGLKVTSAMKKGELQDLIAAAQAEASDDAFDAETEVDEQPEEEEQHVDPKETRDVVVEEEEEEEEPAKEEPKKKEPKAKENKMRDFCKMSFTSLAGTKWTIGTRFASGGFGQLFFVEKENGEKNQFVIKIEQNRPGVGLFLETSVLRKLKGDIEKNHVIPMIDSGKLSKKNMPELTEDEEYFFLIMPQLTYPVNEMEFDEYQSIDLMNQMLKALKYVHEQGYLHLDIKPGNIMLEEEAELENYVLIDFGMALKYKDETKPDKKQVGNGTPTYMAVGAHDGIMSRKNDIESLLYVLHDCLHPDIPLPWTDIKGDAAKKAKQQWLETCDFPKPFHKLVNEVRTLKHGDTPSYKL